MDNHDLFKNQTELLKTTVVQQTACSSTTSYGNPNVTRPNLRIPSELQTTRLLCSSRTPESKPLSLSSVFTAAACHNATRRRGLRPKPFLIRDFLQLTFRNRSPLAVFGFQSAFARFVAGFSVILPFFFFALCSAPPPPSAVFSHPQHTLCLYLSVRRLLPVSIGSQRFSEAKFQFPSQALRHYTESLLECLFLELPRFYLSPPPQFIAFFFTLKPFATFRFDSRINCAQTRHMKEAV
ncbi:uncharacterized protein LOC125469045 [Pyrus x bretschneideri]|uniref:uncharacterized protein LOC125469045 n=1 Tax=Pyrus x bretschneideri TaxID=225117 RepID=UPI0020300F52|nr:uncharacterized protein LOC125469045 [Pyrus x bretschneideri]